MAAKRTEAKKKRISERKSVPKADRPSVTLSLIAYGTELVQTYLERRVSRSAAALSYFFTLSLFPVLLCLYSVLGRVFPDMDVSSLRQLETFIPAETVDTIIDYLTYISLHSSSSMLVVGIVAAVTTAAATFRSLHNTMGDLQGGTRYRGFWSFFSSFLYSIVFMLVIYLSVILMSIGNSVVSMFVGVLGIGALSQLLNLLRFPLLLFIFILLLFGVYRYTAPRHLKDTFFPGAAVAGVVIVLVSMLFSYFIDLSVKYSLVYGTMASIIIYMLWMYIISTILIMGNVLNVTIREHREYNAGLTNEAKL